MPIILSQHAMHSLLMFILKRDTKKVNTLLAYSEFVPHDRDGKNLFYYLITSHDLHFSRSNNQNKINTADTTNKHTVLDCEDLAKFAALTPYLKPDLYDNRGWNSLHTALCTDNILISDYLVEAQQFNVNQSSLERGRTALHMLCILGKNSTAAHIINKYEAEVDVVDNDGNLPIHYALKQEKLDYEFIVFLINQGSPHLENKAGMTPLQIGVATGNRDIVVLLLANLDYIKLAEVEDVMYIAAKNGYANLINLFIPYLVDSEISQIAAVLRNTISLAVANNHAKVVLTLLELYADTNLRIMALKIAIEKHNLHMLAILKVGAKPEEIEIARSHLTTLKENGVIVYPNPSEFKRKDRDIKKVLSNNVESEIKLSASKRVTFLAESVERISKPLSPPATPPAALPIKGDKIYLSSTPVHAYQ